MKAAHQAMNTTSESNETTFQGDKEVGWAHGKGFLDLMVTPGCLHYSHSYLWIYTQSR